MFSKSNPLKANHINNAAKAKEITMVAIVFSGEDFLLFSNV
jgi:hypothetical protein